MSSGYSTSNGTENPVISRTPNMDHTQVSIADNLTIKSSRSSSSRCGTHLDVNGQKERTADTQHTSSAETRFHVFFSSMKAPYSDKDSKSIVDVNSGDSKIDNMASQPEANASYPDMDTRGVEALFDKMHTFLQNRRTVSRKARRYYQICPQHTVEETKERLGIVRQTSQARSEATLEDPDPTDSRDDEYKKSRRHDIISNRSHESDNDDASGRGWSEHGARRPVRRKPLPKRKSYPELKIMLYKHAKRMFTLFLPLHFKSKMVLKYWGAICCLIEVN